MVETRFLALRRISRFLHWFAIVLGCWFGLTFVSAFLLPSVYGEFVEQGLFAGLTYSESGIVLFWDSLIQVTIPQMFFSLMVYVVSELILALLAIEENTQTTAEMLRLRRKPGQENPER